MKIINLLLVLTVFGCYTGICRYFADIPVTGKSVAHSCHEKMVSDGDSQDGYAPQYYSKISDSVNGQCCLKTSTKSQYNPDDRKASFYTFSNVVSGDENVKTAITSATDASLVYYRPPELFITNSTLLL